MVSFLKVEVSTNKIVGTQRGPELIVAPVGRRHIERTDAEMDTYHALYNEMRVDGRSSALVEIAGIVSIEADTRPYVDVSVDKTEIDADGVDIVTLTVQILAPDGTPTTAFNGNFKALLFGEFWVRLNFTNGVAVKPLSTVRSGVYELKSTNDYKVKTSVVVEALV